MIRTIMRVAIAASLITTLSGQAAAEFAGIQAISYNEGLIWSNFSYAYGIVANPGVFYNDVEIQFKDLSSIDPGGYVLPPGAGILPPPPANPNLLVISTANPAGFPGTITIGATSVDNPNTIEGIQRFTITANNTAVGPFTPFSVLNPSPGVQPTGFIPGATTVAFAVGTFTANAFIDLFQDTTLAGQTAHLGFGTALADGSAMISLSRPLTTEDLAIGVNGQIVNFASIPEPTSLILFAVGVAGVLGLTRLHGRFSRIGAG